MSNTPLPTFASTHWTVVRAAQGQATAESKQALCQLCQMYWYPLYAFVRRKGYSPEEAQDATQSFFAELLEKDRLQMANQDRGRFRSFLLSSLKNFLANRSRDARALKRGGGQPVFRLDFERGEQRYLHEPFHDATPERIFERRWATAVLDKTIALLREEFVGQEKAQLFDELIPYLGGDAKAGYEAIAARVGMTAGALKVAAHRLRKRCAQLLRAEIAQTVSCPEEVEDEIRTLFQSLQSD